MAQKYLVMTSGLEPHNLLDLDFLSRQLFGADSQVDLCAYFWGMADKDHRALNWELGNLMIEVGDPPDSFIQEVGECFTFPETDLGRLFAMFLGRQRLRFLASRIPKDQYEVIAFLRPDLTIPTFSFAPSAPWFQMNNPKQIFLPRVGQYRNGVTDLMFLGGAESVEKLLDVYDDMPTLVNSRMDSTGYQCPVHQESLILASIMSNKLEASLCDFGDLYIRKSNRYIRITDEPRREYLSLAKELVRVNDCSKKIDMSSHVFARERSY